MACGQGPTTEILPAIDDRAEQLRGTFRVVECRVRFACVEGDFRCRARPGQNGLAECKSG